MRRLPRAGLIALVGLILLAPATSAVTPQQISPPDGAVFGSASEVEFQVQAERYKGLFLPGRQPP